MTLAVTTSAYWRKPVVLEPHDEGPEMTLD